MASLSKRAIGRSCRPLRPVEWTSGSDGPPLRQRLLIADAQDVIAQQFFFLRDLVEKREREIARVDYSQGSSFTVDNRGASKGPLVQDRPDPFQRLLDMARENWRGHHGARARAQHVGSAAGEQLDDVAPANHTYSGAAAIAYDHERRFGICKNPGGLASRGLTAQHRESLLRSVEIGRASCRERVESWVVGGRVKKKKE